MTPSETLDVALQVGRALDRVGIPYFVGGSLASSLQGEPRATNDIDLVVDLPLQEIERLAAELGPDFELDTEALAEAVRRRSSWNIYHLPTVTKVDLFIRRHSPFDDSEFARRRPIDVAPGATLQVKSPEDTVLRKLLWFKQGGEVSSSQWRDIVEVLRVSGRLIDAAYVSSWAQQLGVLTLLERAERDAASRMA